MFRAALCVAVLMAGGPELFPAAAPASAGQPAAPTTHAEQLEFLRRARIVAAKPIGRGVTRPWRLTLSNGTFTHDAAFNSVDERNTERDFRDGRKRAGELRFVDSWKYNVAAYRIAGLLGIEDMMPPTVQRAWNGRFGSLSWWVDDVLMDEAEREEKGITPPDVRPWYEARQRMVVFAALLYDMDRNKGNVLYTRDWRVIMIDFTRAFRLERELRRPDMLDRVDRRLYERIEQLARADVERETRDYLTPIEITALFARRDAMVAHFRTLIETRGANVVFY
ncbi:MAG: hypothetical protein AB1635_20005 [Acidobacteriota bacterium]